MCQHDGATALVDTGKTTLFMAASLGIGIGIIGSNSFALQC